MQFYRLRLRLRLELNVPSIFKNAVAGCSPRQYIRYNILKWTKMTEMWLLPDRRRNVMFMLNNWNKEISYTNIVSPTYFRF
jgi:hypothetical protein